MIGIMNETPSGIRDRLLPQERVIWWGRPAQGLVLTARDVFLIPFSVIWGGFAIVWETIALQAKTPFPFALFGIPFVVIGLFLIFGRFLVDSWLRRRLVYAVTDRRILIARSGPRPSFRALNRDNLPEIALKEGSGGWGTITFGRSVPMFGAFNGGGYGGWIPALDPTPQFLQIEDVRRVFAAVQTR